jgi:prepilin-type N-terminal cleavage/methylation domain-containing protein
MLSSQRGFTLIELLLVTSIIALLATVVLTSVNGQRRRARDVSFQTTVKAIQKSAGICCTGGSGTLLDTIGGNICNPDVKDKYPTSENIGAVEIIRNCGSVDGYMLRIYPGTGNAGSINHADCDRDDCTYTYNSY